MALQALEPPSLLSLMTTPISSQTESESEGLSSSQIEGKLEADYRKYWQRELPDRSASRPQKKAFLGESMGGWRILMTAFLQKKLRFTPAIDTAFVDWITWVRSVKNIGLPFELDLDCVEMVTKTRTALDMILADMTWSRAARMAPRPVFIFKSDREKVICGLVSGTAWLVLREMVMGRPARTDPREDIVSWCKEVEGQAWAIIKVMNKTEIEIPEPWKDEIRALYSILDDEALATNDAYQVEDRPDFVRDQPGPVGTTTFQASISREKAKPGPLSNIIAKFPPLTRSPRLLDGDIMEFRSWISPFVTVLNELTKMASKKANEVTHDMRAIYAVFLDLETQWGDMYPRSSRRLKREDIAALGSIDYFPEWNKGKATTPDLRTGIPARLFAPKAVAYVREGTHKLKDNRKNIKHSDVIRALNIGRAWYRYACPTFGVLSNAEVTFIDEFVKALKGEGAQMPFGKEWLRPRLQARVPEDMWPEPANIEMPVQEAPPKAAGPPAARPLRSRKQAVTANPRPVLQNPFALSSEAAARQEAQGSQGDGPAEHREVGREDVFVPLQTTSDDAYLDTASGAYPVIEGLQPFQDSEDHNGLLPFPSPAARTVALPLQGGSVRITVSAPADNQVQIPASIPTDNEVRRPPSVPSLTQTSVVRPGDSTDSGPTGGTRGATALSQVPISEAPVQTQQTEGEEEATETRSTAVKEPAANVHLALASPSASGPIEDNPPISGPTFSTRNGAPPPTNAATSASGPLAGPSPGRISRLEADNSVAGQPPAASGSDASTNPSGFPHGPTGGNIRGVESSAAERSDMTLLKAPLVQLEPARPSVNRLEPLSTTVGRPEVPTHAHSAIGGIDGVPHFPDTHIDDDPMIVDNPSEEVWHAPPADVHALDSSTYPEVSADADADLQSSSANIERTGPAVGPSISGRMDGWNEAQSASDAAAFSSMGDVTVHAVEPSTHIPPAPYVTVSAAIPPPSPKRRRLQTSAVTEDILQDAERRGHTLLQWTKKGDKLDATFTHPPGAARSMGIAETRDELSSLLASFGQIREALERDIQEQGDLA